MTALFDSNSNLVGWQKNEKHIFDLQMNWVAYISNLNVWSVKTGNWIGVSYGLNMRDTNGKTIFWNPKQQIKNSIKPLEPLKPLKPLKPLNPLKRMKPLKPPKPLAPLGGWSNLTWKQFINM